MVHPSLQSIKKFITCCQSQVNICSLLMEKGCYMKHGIWTSKYFKAFCNETQVFLETILFAFPCYTQLIQIILTSPLNTKYTCRAPLHDIKIYYILLLLYMIWLILRELYSGNKKKEKEKNDEVIGFSITITRVSVYIYEQKINYSL